MFNRDIFGNFRDLRDLRVKEKAAVSPARSRVLRLALEASNKDLK